MEETNEEKITEQKNDDEPSLSPLKTVEPVDNITVLSRDSIDSTEVVEKVIVPDNIKTVFDKKSPKNVEDVPIIKEEVLIKEDKIKKEDSRKEPVEIQPLTPSKQPQKVIAEKKRVGSASSAIVSGKIDKNHSDIFSLKEENTISDLIFSVNGSPSRKVYRQVQNVPSDSPYPFGQVAEPHPNQVSPRDKMRDKDSYHDVKRPSHCIRNPLTGTGLSSNDEYKFHKGNKRTDGNPILGLGYTSDIAPSTHRIPPGGYSHKLW
ncbi:uncharacterized protein LOC114325114 [Diabrotica virgifera virgifera]|uniref:Uncharacterized protein LOC114325114 n=1 Tax=Diabrotica virgifera virgifera TaxID=50390 RepID=A0A6P7F1Y1_DIAVI|nr:uncharacterized protein LOC114325114 [Diabrotica virgifera virgifera]